MSSWQYHNRGHLRILRKNWARQLFNGSGYGIAVGYLADAIEMASKSRNLKIVISDMDDEDVLRSTHRLALTYRKQEWWDKAEKLQIEVMEKYKGKPSDEDSDIDTKYGMRLLRSMDSLVLNDMISWPGPVAGGRETLQRSHGDGRDQAQQRRS